MDHLGGGLFFFRDTTDRYGTMEDFFKAIDRNNPCNIASMIGHCSARAGVAGNSGRPARRKKPFNKLKLWIQFNVSSKLLGFGLNDIEIAYISEDGQKFEGKTVRQIARERKKRELDAYLYLCEKSSFKGRVNMGPYSTLEIIGELSKDDHCLYMTDAWVEDRGVQNPAIYDCFPKFLRASLLGTGDTMERTIRKMTGATADRFSLKDRGYLGDGYFADITVFHEGELKGATPDQQKSFEIKKVFINGSLVLEDGNIDVILLKNAGRAVRNNTETED